MISVLMLILIALIFTEKMKYLSFINPEKFAYVILLAGFFVFAVKLFNHYKKLPISNKSNKVRNMSRKPSKSVSSKKIN